MFAILNGINQLVKYDNNSYNYFLPHSHAVSFLKTTAKSKKLLPTVLYNPFSSGRSCIWIYD